MNHLRILSLPVDDAGCGWYRIRQPFQMIQDTTEHDAHVIDAGEDNMIAVTQAMSVADVVVVRQGGESGMRQLKTFPEFKRVKWVLDIDDNVELISPYSLHYKDYGTQEFYDKNTKQWVWKDGSPGFDLAKNRSRIASFLQGMREVDLVTVTTPKLAEYVRGFNKNVVVLPNCVNTDAWWPLDLKPNKQLRVGWSGGVSHYEDWYELKEPLNDLLREYKFTLVMVGSHYEGLIDPDNRQYVEVRPWVPFPAHSYRMMCLDLDIGIIPVADLPFNAYKSAVKWYEFAAMGVPCVVAGRSPYEEEISLKTSSPYGNTTGFVYALEQLLAQPKQRTQIVKNARAWVLAHRDAAKNIHLWTDAYRSII